MTHQLKIIVECPVGSGKTTLVAYLAHLLNSQGLAVSVTDPSPEAREVFDKGDAGINTYFYDKIEIEAVDSQS